MPIELVGIMTEKTAHVSRHYPFIDDPFPDHPYASLFPFIPDEELQELAKSIKADGQITPLVIYQGKILDGRNRYRAISLINSQLKHGDAPIALKYGHFLDGQTGPHADFMALKLVEKTNLHRRNLSISQRAAIALSIEEIYSEIAKEERRLCLERQRELESSVVNSQPGSKENKSAYKAAIASGVGQQSVSRAKAIKEANPELFKEVLAGDKSINSAYNQIKAIKPLPVAPVIPAIDDSEQLSKDLSNEFIKSCDLILPAHIWLCLDAIFKYHPETLNQWIEDHAIRNNSIT